MDIYLIRDLHIPSHLSLIPPMVADSLLVQADGRGAGA